MNREIWSETLVESNSISDYPCPECRSGKLYLLSEQREFLFQVAKAPKQALPGNEVYLVSGLLKCGNVKCQNKVAFNALVSKKYSLLYDVKKGSSKIVNADFYSFRHFFPNLKLFRLNKKIPKDIQAQINLSFASFFSDSSSAANRLRNAIEVLLDEIKAPKKAKNRKGKFYQFNNIHSRIENFRDKKNKEIGNLLMANKIIGNAGSHIGSISNEDLLDGYEILELVCEKLFVKRDKSIKTIAEIINSRNSVRSK